MTKRVRFMVALLVVAFVAAACGDDDDSAGGTTTTAGGTGSTAAAGPEPWKCVDPDAEQPQEGDELVFTWGAGSTGAGVERFVKPAVAETVGLDMTVLGAPSSETMAQIIGQGGAGDLDIVFTSVGPLEQGRAEDVLSVIDYSVLPETASFEERYLDPGGDDLAVTTSEFAYGLAYNTDTLEELGLPVPESIEDMLDPVYAPVLGIYTPPFAGAVAQFAVINAVLGGPPEDLTMGIEAVAALEGQTIANSAQMDSAFAAGDVGMFFSASATVQAYVDDGLPVEMVYGPAYGTGIYAIIPKDPPHPGAACTFLNWAASVEGQEALQQVNGNLPTRRDGVTVRPDTIMESAQGEEILDYPALIADAPPAEAITEQWNQARGG